MAEQLEEVLEDLGLAQYHESFVDQGFDTWETILDITESDLYAVSQPTVAARASAGVPFLRFVC